MKHKPMEEVQFDPSKQLFKKITEKTREAVDKLVGLGKEEAVKALEKLVGDKQIPEFKVLKIGQPTTLDLVNGRVILFLNKDNNVERAHIE